MEYLFLAAAHYFHFRMKWSLISGKLTQRSHAGLKEAWSGWSGEIKRNMAGIDGTNSIKKALKLSQCIEFHLLLSKPPLFWLDFGAI